MKTAILVDGGFYRKRAYKLWGDKNPITRANELFEYCLSHTNMQDQKNKGADKCILYRIFYYDCLPISKKVFHPLLRQTIDLGKSDTYQWTNDFLDELKKKRKVAIRLGELSESSLGYVLSNDATKKLFGGAKELKDITEDDFSFRANQKGVDMRIGLDIASLSYKKQVDQIILISGDSDFVSAAKLARREGIDFILDPMWADIKSNLSEHVDGILSPTRNPKDPTVTTNTKKKTRKTNTKKKK